MKKASYYSFVCSYTEGYIDFEQWEFNQSEKNHRIANTVVYIIACYVIYYIILVYGLHKKNKQLKSIVAELFQSKQLMNI